MRGGLASWKIAKMMLYLEANIGVSIQIADLAQPVRISSSHFCRAFKRALGNRRMRRRVERAQALMLATRASLSQIAVDCGIADQAHFSKPFRRFVGESPSVWRRARVPTPAPCAPPQSQVLGRISGKAATKAVPPSKVRTLPVT